MDIYLDGDTLFALEGDGGAVDEQHLLLPDAHVFLYAHNLLNIEMIKNLNYFFVCLNCA